MCEEELVNYTSTINDEVIQKGIDKFYNYYYPKYIEPKADNSLNDEDRAFVDFLVSTTDLDNSIIVSTYGKNLQCIIENEAKNVIDNSSNKAEDILGNIFNTVEEYIKDCEALNSEKKRLFKPTVSINTIKKKYLNVATSLDNTVIKLKQENRSILSNILSIERLINRIDDVDKKLNLYIIAGKKVLSGKKNIVFKIYSNIDEFNDNDFNKIKLFNERINDLELQKYLLATQMAQLQTILQNSNVVYSKIEDMLQNVIPKWRLHMALLLEIQFVNKAILNDRMLEELNLLLLKEKQKDSLNNNRLIDALINATSIIKNQD